MINCNIEVIVNQLKLNGIDFEIIQSSPWLDNYKFASIKNVISTEKKRLSDKKIELATKIDSMNSNSLEQILGFKPSIYNYVKLLLAHTETLLYIIKNCYNEIEINKIKIINCRKHLLFLKYIKKSNVKYLELAFLDYGEFIKN